MGKKPWIDKYRPKTLNDIVKQDDIIKLLKKTAKNENLPHLLFYGPSGTGKTSSILAIAKELFGNNIKDRVIELNASDERGINIVRNKIAHFAKLTINHDNSCPKYKIIILDEADAMTIDAQSALRKIIEETSKNTRFCLICNYIHQIIDPIASRCAKFRFKPLDVDSVINMLINISKKEKLKINIDCIKTIATISKGDLRKAITLLQNTKYIIKYNKGNITPDNILEMDGYIKSKVTKKLWNSCINKKNELSDIRIYCNEIIKKGYSILFLIEELMEHVISSNKIDDKIKANICLNISQCEQYLIEGADEYIQLLNLLLKIYKSIKNTDNMQSVLTV